MFPVFADDLQIKERIVANDGIGPVWYNGKIKLTSDKIYIDHLWQKEEVERLLK